MGRTPQPHPQLRAALDGLARKFSAERDVESDPIRYVLRYAAPVDREAVAFIVATLSFGNVRAIFQSVERLLGALSSSPADDIRRWSAADAPRVQSIYHRWVTGPDLHVLLLTLGGIYRSHGSLEAFFLDTDADAMEPRIRDFGVRFRASMAEAHGGALSRGMKFMVPAIGPGSVGKRFNMFLRWVVRAPTPDLGLWTKVRPAELFLPVDTHLERLAYYLRFIGKKDRGWGMVRKATQALAAINPVDPVAYDFALARLGILKLCRHRYERQACSRCALRPYCRLAAGRH